MKFKETREVFSLSNNLELLFKRPERKHLPVLDGFRALSFHWVYLFHVYYILLIFVPEKEVTDFIENIPFAMLIWRGTLSVDVFFVTSGFLIARIMISEYRKKDSINIFLFYKRRFLRLMPIYYIAVLIMAIGYRPEWIILQDDNSINVWANILYINNFLPPENQFMLWSWSLAVEEQFYIIFPVLFLLLTKIPKKKFAILWSLLLGFLFIRIILLDTSLFTGTQTELYFLELSSHFFDDLYDNLYTRAGAILCGIIAAYYFEYKTEMITTVVSNLGKRILWVELALITLIVSITFANFDIQSIFGVIYLISFRIVFSMALALLFVVYLTGKSENLICKSFFEAKVFYPLAQLSYSFYIWHPMALFVFYFVFWADKGSLSTNEIITTAIISYFISMVLSVWGFILIEKPFMNLRKFLK